VKKQVKTVEYRICGALKNTVRVSYASGEDTMRPELDCGEGINTALVCEAARDAFSRLNFDLCIDYPHGTELKDAVVRRWNGRIERDQVVLTEGSAGALYLTNRIFLEAESAVLGGASLFFEYGTDVRLHGARYDEVPLRAAENWKFSADRFIGMMTPEYRLIYLDNPHNPTGQVIPLQDIERIVSRAAELNCCVLVDEAYGGFMDDENSAVCLMKKYSNVLTARSFSKAFGLGGLRAGYLLLPPSLTAYAENLSNPYVVSALSRRIAAAALGDAEFLIRLRQETHAAKQKLYCPWKCLSLAETCGTTNICMITHSNPGTDLERLFAERGVRVISCRGFAGANSVRLRVPAMHDMDRLLAVIGQIDKIH
jgi:histidinol-phosphate aminotransferase